ncbi:MAG: SDR family NAD(P)-dependent oxidoreductase [Candidatus Andersenbacteria bacterium]
MKRILITGGAGFIGSHVTEQLLQKGHEVWVVDNFSTGSRENLAHLHVEHLHIIEGDVRDEAMLEPVMNNVEQVYHLAASVGVKHIMDNLVASIHNNIAGTEAVLKVASRAGKKVLLTSTSEVYGKSSDTPSREDDDLRMGETIKSRWSYACSKALDEYLAFAYYHEYQLPVTIVRLFNTVGERQTSKYGMVLPTFIRQALRNEPLTIHGNGEQSRCFGYVRDVVWALERLMESSKTVGQVYNVGNPEQVTINELADRVIAATESTSVKEYIPYTEAYKSGFDDAARRQPNIDKVYRAIGFQSKHTLEEIIYIMVAAERQSLKVVRARA